MLTPRTSASLPCWKFSFYRHHEGCLYKVKTSIRSQFVHKLFQTLNSMPEDQHLQAQVLLNKDLECRNLLFSGFLRLKGVMRINLMSRRHLSEMYGTERKGYSEVFVAFGALMSEHSQLPKSTSSTSTFPQSMHDIDGQPKKLKKSLYKQPYKQEYERVSHWQEGVQRRSTDEIWRQRDHNDEIVTKDTYSRVP